MFRRVVWTLLILFISTASHAQRPSLTAKWVNQRNSEMTITSVDAQGLVTGTYINKASGFGCQNTSYPLTGWTDGVRMAISVRWKNATDDCNSITSWIGSLEGDVLKLQWKIVYIDEQGKPAFKDGADDFSRQ